MPKSFRVQRGAVGWWAKGDVFDLPDDPAEAKRVIDPKILNRLIASHDLVEIPFEEPTQLPAEEVTASDATPRPRSKNSDDAKSQVTGVDNT